MSYCLKIVSFYESCLVFFFFYFIFFFYFFVCFFFFQAEDGIRDRSPSRGLGDVYKRQLTKKLGVGLVCNANRVGQAPKGAMEEAVASMTMLNKKAAEISHRYEIHACTDVTGFGFLGHLSEMINDTVSAEIDSISLPVIRGALHCAEEFLLTAAAQRNRNHVAERVTFSKYIPFAMEELLFDPQTLSLIHI